MEQAEIFDIRIDEAGKAFIRKLYRLIGVIYVLLILVTLFSTADDIYWLIQNNKIPTSTPWFYIRIKIFPFLYIVVNILNVLGIYYYVKSYRIFYQGIIELNQVLFNEGFRYLLRNSTIFIIIMSINLLLDIFAVIGIFIR